MAEERRGDLIRLIRPVYLYSIQNIADAHHSYNIPALRQTLRGVIDRFKAMDRFCFVEGDMNGALTLRVENDTYVTRLKRDANAVD